MAKDDAGFQTERSMTTPATTPADGELLPCPFCGAGETVLHVNKGTWLGRGYGEPVSVEIRHWCPQEPGQPSRPILRIGRDESSAIAAWNRRATPSPGKAPEPVAWRHEIVEPTGQHLTLYSASPDNQWSHWIGQYRDECRYTATPLYASPGKAAAEDAARYRWIAENAIVETAQWRNDGRDPASTKHVLDRAIDAAIQQERDK